MKASHRTFTHSLLAMFLYTFAVWVVCLQMHRAFLFAYGSHLALDLLNKKPIPLFYPVHWSACLKLCYADGLANRALLYLGTGLSAAMLLACGVRIWM